MMQNVKFLVGIISEHQAKSDIPDVRKWNCWTFTESLKGFELKPLWVFSYSPRDKNFRDFPYE